MPVGPLELGIILVIIIIIFGVGKLPEIGGALGKGIREFRETAREPGEDEEEEATTANSAESGTATTQQQSQSSASNEPAKEEL